MTTDLCTEDVVVCIASPQMITGGVGAAVTAGGRVASSAAVELGRRLLLAARSGNTSLVLDLMAKGAPFTTDWLGTSPLHLAATNSHLETCAVLLRAGVSRDARTKVDRTPLHMAAYAGHADVVRLLLDHGAALDCKDMLRMTPLHWAAQRGHTAVAQELVSRGCSVSPCNKFVKTPRDLAEAAGHSDIVAIIDAAAERLRDAEMRVQAVTLEDPVTRPAPITIPRRVKAAREDLVVTEERILPAQGFPTIHRIQEIKPTAKTKIQQENPPKIDLQTEDGSDSRAAALLRRHGITLLPTDDGSTVLSALQCGRTVVLSDAGKLMLKESSSPQVVSAPVSTPVSTPVPTPTLSTAGTQPQKGYKVFTLNNKLILPKANKNLGNVQLSQLKVVQLPRTAASPRKPISVRARSTPLNIVVTNHKPNHADVKTTEQVETTNSDEDKESLRSQLQAARKAIAALTAELASCKARLAQLEQRQT